MKLWKVIAAVLSALWAVPAAAQQVQCITGPNGIGPSGCFGYAVTLVDANGNPVVLGGGGGGSVDQTGQNNSDGQATTTGNLHGLSFNYIFNGTTWDRWRGTGGAANVSVTNFPGTQTIGGTVSANQGAAGGTAWPVSLSSLPAFAATPTFNLGTLNGAALDTSVQQVKTALGSPFQAGGSIGNTSFGSTIADGADAALGSKADAANAATGSTAMAIFRQLHADLIAPTPAGTAIIGKVGIDQTTPGTTNKVSIGSDGTVAIASGQALISQGLYLTSGQTLGNASYAPTALDVNAHPLVAESGSKDPQAGITPVVTAAGTSAVGKASAGNLYSAYAVNSAATAAYLVCIDAAATPSASAAITPKDVAYLGNTIGATAQINYGAGPPNVYTIGITCLVTTSLTTYTAGPNDFISVRAR